MPLSWEAIYDDAQLQALIWEDGHGVEACASQDGTDKDKPASWSAHFSMILGGQAESIEEAKVKAARAVSAIQERCIKVGVSSDTLKEMYAAVEEGEQENAYLKAINADLLAALEEIASYKVSVLPRNKTLRDISIGVGICKEIAQAALATARGESHG